jgi:amino acid adenylation domain-containing protein
MGLLVDGDAGDVVLVVDSASLAALPPPTAPKGTHKVLPGDQAYIIFTSGTTGTPKGIVVEHGAFCAGALAHGKAMLLESTSRVLQFASYSFDACLVEMLTTLIHGGCVCVPEPAQRGPGIESAMEAMKVNWAVLVPSFARLLRSEKLPSLKTLVLAGEAMDPHDVSAWTKTTRLVNGYGPSECCVAAVVNSTMDVGSDPCEIGRAVGCRTWVVDASDHHRLLPVGCVGELLIQGPILARGYLDDEARTEQTFVRHPRWADGLGEPPVKDTRFYKTGDLVRYDENGALYFVGRKDTQVKVNGQRMELGEIEYHVRKALPSRWLVAVHALRQRLDGDHGRSLPVAFFQSDEEAEYTDDHRKVVEEKRATTESPGTAPRMIAMTPTMQTAIKEAQEMLPAHLPDFSIPSLFVPLSSLPTLLSGKIDRSKIAQLASNIPLEKLLRHSRVGTRQGAAAGGDLTATEREIRFLWASVLGFQPEVIDVSDSFFRLGGDSLAAMRLAVLAQDKGIVLAAADIFHRPTLAQQVALARARGAVAGAERGAHPVEPYSLLGSARLSRESMIQQAAALCGVDDSLVEDLVPCTPLQEGLMALSIKRAGSCINRMVYRMPDGVDITRFQAAWEALVNLHAILRTRIVQLEHGDMVQVVLGRQQTAWVTADGLDVFVTRDSTLPMGLGDRLSRWAIAGSKYFIWTMHHAVHDGWSVPLLLRAASLLYGDAGVPAPPPVPFARFISHLQKTNPDACSDFWLRQLNGASAAPFPPRGRSSSRERRAPMPHSRLSCARHGPLLSLIIRAPRMWCLAPYPAAGKPLCRASTPWPDQPSRRYPSA